MAATGTPATPSPRLPSIDLIPHVPFDWTAFPSAKGLWMILFVKGGLQFGGEQGPVAFVQYPLLPWFGVMLCGYWLGTRFSLPADERRRWLLRAGLLTTALFVSLRLFCPYGDPQPLLTIGWRRHGLLSVHELPAAS